jgi:lysozyme
MSNQDLISRLKHKEGFRSLPYKCPAGKLTVGYGHNLEVPMPEDLADLILRWDVLQARDGYNGLNRLIRMACNEQRKAVLIEMIFWIGLRGLMSFRRMLAAIERQDFHLAAHELMDSKMGREYPGRAAELAEMMRNG